MLAVAVVVAAAFVLLCVASPTYYDMKLTKVPGGNYTFMTTLPANDDGHSERMKLGLDYSSYWRVGLWGTAGISVIIIRDLYRFLSH